MVCVTCIRAASIARDMSSGLGSIYPADVLKEAAGQIDRHYRRECECFGTTDETIGLRKRARRLWDSI